MNKTTSNLFFLAIGAAVGSIATYIATSNKTDVWLNDINTLVNKIKNKGKNIIDVEPEAELDDPEDFIVLEDLDELGDLVELNDLEQ